MGKQYSEERQPLVSTRQGQSLVEVAPSPPAATRPSKAPRRTLAAIAVVAAVAIVAAMALTSNSVPALGTSQLTGKGDFDEHGRYRMKDFDTAKPMSNFLPGIGGLWGVPMWAFYVNRGQGIASFGMQNKDGPIMKFDTANLAYSTTPTNGFRTMLKVTRPSAKDSTAVPALMQPFMPKSTAQCLPGAAPMPQRDMYIGANEMEVREADETNGISTSATYFTIPEEDFPALVRRVQFTNTGKTKATVDVIDGLAKLEPFGVKNQPLNEMGRTLEGWFHVYNVDETLTMAEGADSGSALPFYHMVCSAEDTAEVHLITEGTFAVAFVETDANLDKDDRHALLPIIADPKVLFGTDTTMSQPANFFAEGASLATLDGTAQLLSSQTPSGFAAATLEIEAGETATMTIVYGHATSVEEFTGVIAPKLSTKGYISSKREAARQLVKDITKRVETTTASKRFDNYVTMNYLDNVLRGGLPVKLGDPANPRIYHTYSRIHGDLERDYNSFQIDVAYFSQGPGNFRDVNQNRRVDVSQEPMVKDFNVRSFLSFVQSDGYNQLTVATAFFHIKDKNTVRALVARLAPPGPMATALQEILNNPFRPGDLFKKIKSEQIDIMMPREQLLDLVVAQAEQVPAGSFPGDQNGFWLDHWTYDLDLVHNYLAVYPDKEESLLWDSAPLPFFSSPAVVMPRDMKYMLNNDKGDVRQFNAVAFGDSCPQEKKDALQKYFDSGNFVGDEFAGGIWMTTADGDVFKVSVAAKLIILAANKFALLDPAGMGIEMEAGKPGWNDAMNGLPGLIGSEMPTAYEVSELVKYVRDAFHRHGRAVKLPDEFSDLLTAIAEALADESLDDFAYWDTTRTALETYRAATAVYFEGSTTLWTGLKVETLFTAMLAKLRRGAAKAVALNGGLSPTYFQNTVTSYELTGGYNDNKGRPLVKALEFESVTLPLFLEGPTRYLKTIDDVDAARDVYERVKASNLYDSELEMYTICESLVGQSFELGRMLAFNPGWLENQSVWLHMSYKFYLELLRSRLYPEYFEEIKTGLVPFMDPVTFGRSPNEAASFIVSSVFPNKELHGTGFLARLSGSTAEFLSMWNIMMSGHEPFYVDTEANLKLSLKPILADWFFEGDGEASFVFLGAVDVTYHNPALKNTWECKVHGYKLHFGKETVAVKGDEVGTALAKRVRLLEATSIDVYLE